MVLQELFMIPTVIFLVHTATIGSAPVSDNQSVSDNTGYSGEFLLDLGTNVSNPLLRLIGKTLQKYDDKLRAAEQRLTDSMCAHPCSEWESWTKCTVDVQGQFGVRSRTRDCTSNSKTCPKVDTSAMPTVESGVCEGWCPAAYNFTGGYCLKLYNTQKMAQYDAQVTCQQDGGHLVNVNTKAKSDAMHAVFTSQGITTEPVWINGNRTQTTADWHYTYGSVPDFDNWPSGEPSNGASELCKVDNHSRRVWYDRPCKDAYYYCCEII